MMLFGFFDRPWLLILAFVLPALIVVLLIGATRRRRARLDALGSRAMLARLTPGDVSARGRWRMIRLALAASLAGIAIAGPRWGMEQTVVRGEGIDVVLALDASLSMLAQDEAPSRLERMKQEVRRLLAQSRGDRVALLAFAGRSYILTPLTVDEGAIELFLENLDPSVVGQAGSSLSRTIRQGTDLLAATDGGSDRALVVMSDGEVFEPDEDVREAAAAAAAAGISLVTVGFGTEAGSTIPQRIGGAVVEKRDEQGTVVTTRYSPATLSLAAEAANGQFVAANETDKAGRVRAALSRLRTQTRAIESGRTRMPRFQFFLLPAFLLVLLDSWRADARLAKRGRRIPPAPPSGTRSRGRDLVATTTAALMLVHMAMPPVVRADDVSDALALYRSGRFAEAAALFRRALDAGDERPQLLYNYATALLAADSTAAAVEAFERVARADDQELRHRALFNLGLAQLNRGLEPDAGDGKDQALDAALDAYRRVLLSRPNDVDAKWNYELALREKQEQSGGGGGGGEDDNPAGGGGGGGAPQGQAEEPAGGLGQQQAEQILGSAAREEQATQGRRQGQGQPQPPAGGPDW